MSTAKDQGITRRVEFVAWCKRAGCTWKSKPADFRYLAAMELGAHTVDRHGGTPRQGDTL